jgi:hypothetical protein
MDPENEEVFDRYIWEGYLFNPRISEDLLHAIKRLFLKVLSRLELSWMAMETGDAFPEAVDSIEDLLLPEKWGLNRHRLQTKASLVGKFPKAALVLVDKLTGRDAGHLGHDLKRLLDAIIQADPTIEKNATYKRLSLLTN